MVDLTWTIIPACLSIIFFIYYMFCVVKKPVIACGNTRLLQFLEQHCPIAHEKFWPTWWCFEGRAQTVLRVILQSFPSAKFEVEYVRTPDGGEIKLDWLHNDEQSSTPRNTRPTVLFMPGTTGTSDENYMRLMVREAREMGYRCIVFNNRGTWGKSVKTPMLFCISKTEDTEFIIAYIKSKFPEAPLVGTGISAGGTLMLNYLAKMKESAQLDAALIASPPFDFRISTPVMEQFLNYWLINKPMASYLQKLIGRSLGVFQQHLDIDGEAIMKTNTIREVDELFTKKMFGYDTAFDYYADAAIHHKIKYIKRPVLVLVAEDDPFAPECSIPFNEVRQRDSNVVIVLTSHGGHIGFMEGMFPTGRSYLYRWFRQYIGAMIEYYVDDTEKMMTN